MFNQNTKFELFVELSAEEQQLLSGGCYQSPPPSCKPKKQKCGCDSQKYDQYPASERDESYPESNSMLGC
ncbi:hypothetical protein VB638_17765 [Dolichospermum sp. UHCC 0684]|jgi:hypothetical protein|uniref:hypothetical protein n=1 Tax=unclassified Dolichospermum TaxID=2622029 RepID=UPI0014459578|nr:MULTISPECIES: hypothetical protein [unclassified Dolichospermum]MEA5531391.1 hypothetical protein [Dolichospermum sp. UHCC 0684]MTJ33361.1 hypothetical protein [Dolichospermum sp. UHCC 0260]